jgi:hypothetical protein
MPDLFRVHLQHSADVLAMVKNQFFLSHGEQKERYRTTITNHESQLRNELAAEYGEGVVDWRIHFAEAFANKRGGFDIVVANPPYVRQELIKDIKPTLKQVFSDDYCGTADLYCFFYLRALQLLRTGGMLACISSNKWFRAAYGEKLRKKLAQETTILELIDFGFNLLKNARGLKRADMLILIGVTTTNLQERNQHVHELTLPWIWSARVGVGFIGLAERCGWTTTRSRGGLNGKPLLSPIPGMAFRFQPFWNCRPLVRAVWASACWSWRTRRGRRCALV